MWVLNCNGHVSLTTKSRKNVASHTSKFFPEMLIKVFLVINRSVARNNSIQFQDLADLFPFVNAQCITVCPTILPPNLMVCHHVPFKMAAQNLEVNRPISVASVAQKGPQRRATVEQSTKDRRRVKLLVPLLWSSLTVVLTDPVDFFESLGSLEHRGAFWMFKAEFREHVDKSVYPNGTHQNPLKSHIRSPLFFINSL